MKKKLMRKFAILSMTMLAATLAFAFALSAPVLAGTPDVWGTQTGNPTGADVVPNATGLGNQDPRVVASQVINVILGFLGIIAVIIILLGGFKWMTAGGNEDKVGEAKKLIMAGVIGLVIILSAFAIANFVMNQLVSATTGTSI